MQCNSESPNLLELVEKIHDDTTEIPCLFKSKTPCTKNAGGFGYCTLHLTTKKGKELQTLWSTAFDMLEAPEEEDSKTDTKKEDESAEGEYVEMTSESESDEDLKKYNIKRKGPNNFQVPLKKTSEGLYVHKATGLVFNTGTGYCYGTLSEDGKRVYNLTEKDIEFCKKYFIKYRSPF